MYFWAIFLLVSCSLNIGFPSISFPERYIAVETVEGVGVKIWTCSGLMWSWSWQNLDSWRMSSSLHPGWAAMK